MTYLFEMKKMYKGCNDIHQLSLGPDQVSGLPKEHTSVLAYPPLMHWFQIRILHGCVHCPFENGACQGRSGSTMRMNYVVHVALASEPQDPEGKDP